MFYISEDKCTGCKACIKACPQEEISIENNKSSIDVNKGTECGRCYLVCQQVAISKELHSSQNISQNSGQVFSISRTGSNNRIGREPVIENGFGRRS